MAGLAESVALSVGRVLVNATNSQAEHGHVDADSTGDQEIRQSLVVFSSIATLAAGQLLVYWLRVKQWSWLPEAWVFFFIGLVFCLVVTFTDYQLLDKVLDAMNNNFSDTFFVVLLPPVIYESGYSMDRRPFFANFGGIIVFAFLGTFVSTLVVGLLTYAAGSIVYSLSMLDALLFGAMVSATDPVTVLAVFQTLGVDRHVYALVFGESVLNDAVAIVLYRTLLRFQTSVSVESVVVGAVYFLVTFLGSLFIGVATGLASALTFKYTDMARPSLVNLERVLTIITPFMSYFLAQGMGLSGVVAILFAGITSAHYTIKNLSPSSRRFSLHVFKTLASICEALVFVYIGAAFPAIISSLPYFPFLLVTFIIVLIARVANVGLGSWLVNRFRSQRNAITRAQQFVLWFSGLRGGVAFALASEAATLLPDPQSGKLIQAACLFFVVVSLFSIGGSIGPLVRHLDMVDPLASSDNRRLSQRRRMRQRRRRRQQLRRTHSKTGTRPAGHVEPATRGSVEASAEPSAGVGGDVDVEAGGGGGAVHSADAQFTAAENGHRRERLSTLGGDSCLADDSSGNEETSDGGVMVEMASIRHSHAGGGLSAAVGGFVSGIRSLVTGTHDGGTYTAVGAHDARAARLTDELGTGASRSGSGSGSDSGSGRGNGVGGSVNGTSDPERAVGEADAPLHVPRHTRSHSDAPGRGRTARRPEPHPAGRSKPAGLAIRMTPALSLSRLSASGSASGPPAAAPAATSPALPPPPPPREARSGSQERPPIPRHHRSTSAERRRHRRRGSGGTADGEIAAVFARSPPTPASEAVGAGEAIRRSISSSWHELDSRVLTPLFTTSPQETGDGSDSGRDIDESEPDLVSASDDLASPARPRARPLHRAGAAKPAALDDRADEAGGAFGGPSAAATPGTDTEPDGPDGGLHSPRQAATSAPGDADESLDAFGDGLTASTPARSLGGAALHGVRTPPQTPGLSPIT